MLHVSCWPVRPPREAPPCPYRHGLLIPLSLAALLSSSCVSVKPVVLDRQTQLENQILGRLQQLERRLILASSVRGPAAKGAEKKRAEKKRARSPLAWQATEAAMNRAFNADDVERLKDRQLAGEAKTGLLQLFGEPKGKKPAADPAARRARELVAEENRDREVIMRRAIQLSPELDASHMGLVRRIFHQLQLRTARPGHRVQKEDGGWITVPRRAGGGGRPGVRR